MKKIVILISGQGSNMQAIIQACIKERWLAKIVAVISNRSNAKGLFFAQSQQIPTHVIEDKKFLSRDAFDKELANIIDQYTPDLIVLAGFMRILSPPFVGRYANKIINIHPSLLPQFPGLHTHKKALATRVKEHGATVHFVTEALDGGPIIKQIIVPVLTDDTEEILAQRVLKAEHILYPEVIKLFIEGHLTNFLSS